MTHMACPSPTQDLCMSRSAIIAVQVRLSVSFRELWPIGRSISIQLLTLVFNILSFVSWTLVQFVQFSVQKNVNVWDSDTVCPRPLGLVSQEMWRHQKRAKKTRIWPTFFRLNETTKLLISPEIFNFMKNLLCGDWTNIILGFRICWEFGCTFCLRKINSKFPIFLLEKLQQKMLNISHFEL